MFLENKESSGQKFKESTLGDRSSVYKFSLSLLSSPSPSKMKSLPFELLKRNRLLTLIVLHEFLRADVFGAEVASYTLRSGTPAINHPGAIRHAQSMVEDRDSNLIQFMSLTDTNDVEIANHWVIP